MDESALIAAIDDSDNRSYGSNLSNLTAALSAERALAIDLYLGKDVDPAPAGQSTVIDRTVFETVQWVLPSLCRIFANGDDVVTLVPDGPQDQDQADQETAYLNWLVCQKHDWFSMFLEWATDAMLTKNAYWLVYRNRKRNVELEKYEAQTKEGIAFLLQDKDVQIVQSTQYEAPDLPPEPVMGPQGPMVNADGTPMMRPAMLYDVTIRRTHEDKDLCIRVLPPERVKVDQRTFSWRIDDRCNYFEYWEEQTLTEIREQGFDVPDDVADDPELYTQEDYARDEYGERRLERYKPSDPSMRRVKARMIWIRCDYDGDGEAELLQVMRIGRRIFYMEEVSRIPVACGVMCPLPHRHIGVSMADMTADLQRIKTAILRQGLDNLYLSNNPQKVINEQMVNVEDALVSRPGGIIRASDINQIRFEDHPFVFPQAVQGLEYMDQVRQFRTGINNNFQGVDASQMGNIQPGTVAQLSSMAAMRVEQIARILAFAIEDLFSIVHEQVLKMGHKQETIQLRGQWVDVDPGGWKKRNRFKICVAFAAGNRDAQIARLALMANKQMEALQAKVPVVTPENYYETLVELTKAADFAAPDRFWTDPKKIPPPPA
ncbi:MAG: portal protein, partial [Candidatus Dormibacteria bacterium]